LSCRKESSLLLACSFLGWLQVKVMNDFAVSAFQKWRLKYKPFQLFLPLQKFSVLVAGFLGLVALKSKTVVGQCCYFPAFSNFFGILGLFGLIVVGLRSCFALLVKWVLQSSLL